MSPGELQQDLPLREIHLPDTLPWWPIATGWWFLLVIALTLLAVLYLLIRYRRQRRLSPWYLATRRLQEIRTSFQLHGDHSKLCRELSILLRRSALTIYPRAQSASISGEQWLQLLDHSVPGQPFSSGVGQLLATYPYQPADDSDSKFDSEALLVLIEQWCMALPKHTRGAAG